MKRIHITALAGICMLFAVVSPMWAIWEGDAGIASGSQFPGPGMYVRSDMFPKNTIIEILNLETDITVRAIVTGPSGVAGLVAVLSPEAATALSIRSGSVSRVRISIPSPVTESPAPGTLSGGTAVQNTDPDINPEVAVAGADTSDKVLKAVTEPAQDPLVALDSREPVAAPITPVVTPPVSESQPVATITEVPAEEILVTTEDPPVETPVEEPSNVVVVEPEPIVTESMTVQPEIEPVATETIPAQIESVEDTAIASTETPVAPEDAYESSVAYDEPELTIAEQPPVSSEEVALVPAEMNPPVVASAEPELVVVETATVEAVPEVSSDPVAPVNTNVSVLAAEPVPQVITTPAPVVEPVAAFVSPVSSAQSSGRTLPLISSLERGSYYVQIASYGDSVNAGAIVDKYGSKYPVAIEKITAKNGEVLRVYIGPVAKDEYGAVLERFKALGFKDAFVKKGQ